MKLLEKIEDLAHEIFGRGTAISIDLPNKSERLEFEKQHPARRTRFLVRVWDKKGKEILKVTGREYDEALRFMYAKLKAQPPRECVT